MSILFPILLISAEVVVTWAGPEGAFSFNASTLQACLPSIDPVASVPGNAPVNSCVTCIRTPKNEVHALTSNPGPDSAKIDVNLHLYKEKTNVTLIFVAQTDVTWHIVNPNTKEIHVNKIILVTAAGSTRAVYPLTSDNHPPAIIKVSILNETAKEDLEKALGPLKFITSSTSIAFTDRWDLWVGLSSVCAAYTVSGPSALTDSTTLWLAIAIPVAAFLIGAVITAVILCRPP